jgi:cytochrome c peroxidase
MMKVERVVMGALALMVSVSACKKDGAEQPAKVEPAKVEQPVKSPLEEARKLASAFKPLPADFKKPGQTAEQEALGKQLYFETRLSKNFDRSCNSCHMLDKFGVDNTPTSSGHKEQLGARNSPTVYNAAGHATQFWDGRAADVEEQAKGPILNGVEMAMPDEALVVATLKSIPGYVESFKLAFPGQDDAITYDNMAAAIGAFERTLVTPSRWDKFLGGDDKALTDDELRGFTLFSQTGCTACHGGTILGGGPLQKVGAVKPWPNQKDQGRFEVTKAESDKMLFKPPSLRNVAKTQPYFHDGSVEKLDEAVKLMAEHQLGRTLPDDEIKLIVAWLGALTGEPDAAVMAAPELPPSGPDTRKPDPT